MVELNLDEIERDALEAEGVTWAVRPAAETVKGREVGPWFVDAEGESVGLFYRQDDARRAVATREEMLALVAEVRRLRGALANARIETPLPPSASSVPVPLPASDPDAINPFLAARAATRARKRTTATPADDE
jgi:hypothetical protein